MGRVAANGSAGSVTSAPCALRASRAEAPFDGEFSIAVPPHAASLAESMRDIGYSLETALADIIDNSISAGATRIDISFDAFSGAPVLAVVDNGESMTNAQLIAAMRPGSRNPREGRATGDLGRFGLGLKTASFSQCRSLTVVCRRGGRTHAARWDLDFVAERNEWLIQVPPAFDLKTLPFIDQLGSKGTLVLWQKLDRLTEEGDTRLRTDHLFQRMDDVRRHLELTFHRFLNGSRPYKKVDVAINRTLIEGYDPFHLNHPATQRLREETIKVGGGKVVVQPYILPHHSKVSVADWEKYGGELGHARAQGFYLYRAGRLIIHSTWFKLAKQTELTKLARVQIDIPTELDASWKIDVKKASGQPPAVVRERLRAIITGITGESGKIFRGRGRKATSSVSAALWGRRMAQSQIHYEVSRDHPLLQSFADGLTHRQRDEFVSVLQAIERALPVDGIFADMASAPSEVTCATLAEAEVIALVALTARSVRTQGGTATALKVALQGAEPWRSHWAVAEKAIEQAFTGVDDDLR